MPALGTPNWLVSEKGTSFKKELMQAVTEEQQTQHHFMTSFSLLANRSVECREVVLTTCPSCVDIKLPAQDRGSVLESVHGFITHKSLQHLDP